MPDIPRKNSAAKTGEWLHQTAAASRLGIPRTTLKGRIARRAFKTKMVGGVLFVWVDAETEEQHRKAS